MRQQSEDMEQQQEVYRIRRERNFRPRRDIFNEYSDSELKQIQTRSKWSNVCYGLSEKLNYQSHAKEPSCDRGNESGINTTIFSDRKNAPVQ